MGKMSSGMRMMALARAQGGNQGNDMGYGGQMTMSNAPEMRRRRDSRGRYMEDQGGNRMAYAENGTDWRPWPEPHIPPYLDRSGTMEDNIQPGQERRGDAGMQNEPYMMRDKNIVNIRDYQDRRRIGFGENRMHYGQEHHQDGEAHNRGEYQMGSGSGQMDQRLTKEMAVEWVEGMKNTDPEHPTGAKWIMESIKPLAIKNGFSSPEKQMEFWAVMNMMYSDYAETAKKHGVSTMDFFADMAKSWMNDKDAVENKTAAYVKCCTK